MMRFLKLKRKKKKKQCAMASTSSSTSLNSYPLPVDSKSNHNTVPEAAEEANTDAISIESSPSTLEQVPTLVQALQDITDADSDLAARILRKLFTISEQHETRIPMVKETNLIMVLLQFCQKCRQKHQQPQLYLALLVLNNVSIPIPNKRQIALEYRAAAVLSVLLCDNPSCHLIAIILVNLTFADANMRRDLVTTNSTDIQIIEALSYALRISIMGESEFETRQHLLQFGDDRSPKERLSVLLDFDQCHAFLIHTPTKDILYPDTARWSLCAIQNLTRPTKDNVNPAAHVLLQLGMLPYILRIVTIDDHHNDMEASFSSLESYGESPPVTSFWDSQSIEDTALFVLLNLTVLPWAHDRLTSETGPVLARITRANHETTKTDGDKIAMHQCIKARMALAYLLGSEGNFGQPNQRRYRKKPSFSELIVGPWEATVFVEMLANLLHRRSVDGPGGYTIANFSVKNFIFALRCLLTQIENQMRFAEANMECLNALLFKCLGLYAFQKVPFLDSQTAEHACFSLYLLSNYGFHTCFLPASIGRGYNARSLVAKVLTSLAELEDVTPATVHGANQILLRTKYLIFEDTDAILENRNITDFFFDYSLVNDARRVVLPEKIRSGAQPRVDIFTRTILRSRARNIHSGSFLTVFPSALYAVQDLSFGSPWVRHVNGIDDIRVANNIAACADGEQSESYGYIWRWEDAEDRIVDDSERRSISASSSPSGRSSVRTIFMVFPAICGCDTT